MAVSSNVFANFWDQALSAPINWPSDTIKMALLTSSAAPNLGTWIHYSDLTNEVANGNGYTTGGVTLTSKTHTVTLANSWGTQWAANNPQNYGDIIRPTSGNGFLFMCDTAGTTSGSQPTWPTVQGQDVADNTANWCCIGESITQWSSAAAQWTSATFSAAYGVIYDAQSGTASTEPLIALINFGGTQTVNNGTLTINPPTNGWFWTTPA